MNRTGYPREPAPAHATARLRRQRNELIANRNGTVVQRTRHDGSDAADAKATVDGKTGRGARASGRLQAIRPARANRVIERRKQLVQALARLGGHRHYQRPRKHGPVQKRLDIELRQRGNLVVGQIAHRERDDHARHTQQLQNPNVLAGLRHHALNGRNHQQRYVHAGGALHHGAQIVRMPGHVDQADNLATGKLELAKTELCSHASAAFDLQTVGIFAGQCLDKGRLSVVDVSCCSNDNGTLDKLARSHRRKPARTASTNADAHRSRSVSRKSVRTSNSTWSWRTRVTTGVSGS